MSGSRGGAAAFAGENAAAGPPGTTRPEEILAGAAGAFSENGYAATSMRQIAQRSGASLGSIYHHFESKEEILRALIADNFRRVHASLETRLAAAGDPRRAFEIFVDNHIGFFARHLEEMRVMSHELDTLRGEAGREISGLRHAYTQRAVQILAKLRPDLSDTDLHVETMCLFGMLNWTYRWFHTVDSGIGPAGLAERMSALFLDGFLERPAAKP